MTIGKKIQKLRKERKLSTRKLANLIGCNHETVERWEWGGSAPGWYYLCRLAEAFKLSLPELVEGVEP